MFGLPINIPLAALVVMNLIPIFGVIYLGWEVKTILLLYWLENVIAGIYNVIKILSIPNSRPSPLFTAIFFSIHYGIFTFVHGLFVLNMGENGAMSGQPEMTAEQAYAALPSEGLFWAALGLAISHAISLIINFYGHGEYKTITASKQMFMPYQRMMILHIVIIVGGLLVEMTGASIMPLIVLVGVKIVLDIGAHILSHKNRAAPVQISENPHAE